MNLKTYERKNYLSLAELAFIVGLALVPLFVSFPYRVNIFLSWEGAYRMSNGEIPFRDFGTPLGGMYWVIPALFFKIFGAKMITLVKAQVFINIISGLAFRSIMKSMGVEPGIRFLSVLVYCLSFSFFNFWPWYNHTVVVYEFIALAFLLKALVNENSKWSGAWLALAALFCCCSFFTKQDAGAMSILLSFALLVYVALQQRKFKPLLIFAGSLIAVFLLFILPLSRYGFGYWFNHGQAPHSARISPFEIVDEFFTGSQWIKFYLFLILVLLVMRFAKWRDLWGQQKEMLFLLLTVGILAESAIFQVTSYIPPDNNIFFHSFAIAFILSQLIRLVPVQVNRPAVVGAFTLGIVIWWSGAYWKYIQRIAERALPSDQAKVSATGENIVNKKTYMITPKDTTDIPLAQWKFSGLKAFDKIYMPGPTVDGIKRLMAMDLIKQKQPLKVLNMTELTPLAVEIPFELEKGSHYPLWYHLGVGMFNKQAEMFEKNIAEKKYDLVLFEHIPTLNNFYPFRVRDSLKVHYQMIDSFIAPRRGDTKGTIEVYVK
ncbi:MAG: hypothetical protein DI535_08840 [Citrobacter freundii]|nr:MAG: hypothetical protein DI535_08840 [Citrobacter freundii]